MYSKIKNINNQLYVLNKRPKKEKKERILTPRQEKPTLIPSPKNEKVPEVIHKSPEKPKRTYNFKNV